jgi:hypothetical protein
VRWKNWKTANLEIYQGIEEAKAQRFIKSCQPDCRKSGDVCMIRVDAQCPMLDA